MTGITRSLIAALGAALLVTGTLQAQARGPLDRHQHYRGLQLQRQGERMQRQAWRMQRHADRLHARGYRYEARRLDRAADRYRVHGWPREWRGARMERRGWI